MFVFHDTPQDHDFVPGGWSGSVPPTAIHTAGPDFEDRIDPPVLPEIVLRNGCGNAECTLKLGFTITMTSRWSSNETREVGGW